MPQQKKKHAILRCKVSRGTFTNEFFVVIELPDGRVLTSLADVSQVVFGANRAAAGESVDAGVKVSVVGEQKGMLLVDLPRETFSQGRRVLVPPTMVESKATA
ncbi:MAG: hypothetical protein A3J28_12435 [Acidobacteria bacterium RIFCSPLOWO2_12_FULL_60_22]|nr:MAG: hypothetical protein A3J28_12435 [Acidobacteria bacterium RIFCSPLOWO2_12_FULL_60_22]